MNLKQVSALHDLMKKAAYGSGAIPYVFDDAGPLDLHVTLAVSHGYDNGNTYEAKLWTTTTTLLRFPDLFYLRDDGKVYTYNLDADECHELKSVSWKSLGKYSYALDALCAEEVLA